MMSPKSVVSRLKGDLIAIYKQAVESVRPESLIRNAIYLREESLLIRDPIDADPSKETEVDIQNAKLHVIGGGKSVLGMASELGHLVSRAKLTEKFSHGVLSIPRGLESVASSEESKRGLASIGVECHFGSVNNLPDDDSVRATSRILENISEACRSDQDGNFESIFIVLLSGGGSACLTSPRFLTLSEKLDIIGRLVQRGAGIKDLNAVRMHFSNVKGGRLSRHILRNNPKARIISLILSDVVGDPIEYIASGPTFVPPNGTSGTSVEQRMRQVLSRYNIDCDISPHLLETCDKSECPEPKLVDNERLVMNRIIGNNTVALNHAETHAKSLGYEVIRFDKQLEGSNEQVLDWMEARKRTAKSGKSLVLAGGETTVKKLPGESWGVGGRLQELCLDYMIGKLTKAEERRPDGLDMLLAGSTDGQDGPTDVAACMASLADHKLSAASSSFTLHDCLEAKRSHNSYKFWSTRRADWLIKSGLSGTNVMDIYLLATIT